METAPLKSFAAWARTTLMREVSARISVVLASQELRQEQPNAVVALERAVNAAGGDKSDAVAEKVAYTWFNRIIALRFMDANGYTGIGVVSPEQGRGGGQPEVLAEAKRGNIDSTVVTNKRTVEAVSSLLNGTRRSDDPQGEAYALLLAEYCRYWNRSMPFMFEREGDYTELLIPANLLADDSVLARTVAVLTQEVCQDVEVIGWLYQFYISERKGEVFAGFKKNKKAGADDIPAATQLFTPHWIVRYLVENSLGRLWLLNRPTSRLADRMDYYIAPVDEEMDYLKVSSPEELKVIDPACGSGHMLTYAFDLIYTIYEEEGYAPSDIPGLILENNLYGTEIDARAGALAAFVLTMKARARQRTFFNKQVQPNICVLEPISFTPAELGALVTQGGDLDGEVAFWTQFEQADTFGSLICPRQGVAEKLRRDLSAHGIDDNLFDLELRESALRVLKQADFLSQRYNVVVANPPYMGAGNMNSSLTEFAKTKYSDSRFDLFAMFIDRNVRLVLPRGFVAMITMQSWLFLTSYEALRRRLLSGGSVVALAHLGTNAFDTIGGAVVSTAAFVIESGVRDVTGDYVRLVDGRSERAKSESLRSAVNDRGKRYESKSSNFADIPGAPFIYWAGEAELELLRHPFARLDDVAATREGLTTGNNDKYLRLWHEVSRSKTRQTDDARAKWVPHVKGGGTRRWYGHNDYVVNWEDDGKELRGRRPQSVIRSPGFYFETGFTWSSLSGGSFAVRHVPGGFIFDTKGPMGFAKDDENATLFSLEAQLNSAVTTRFMTMLAPTLDFKIGHVRSLPIDTTMHERVSHLAERCIEISITDWDMFETSWDFTVSPLRVREGTNLPLHQTVAVHIASMEASVANLRETEERINVVLADSYGLTDTVETQVPVENVTLSMNPAYRYGIDRVADHSKLLSADIVSDLVSYAVGCMLGRYSLDELGLILANQGDTLQDYLIKVPSPTFMPDKDNVIPIIDGDWFEDDIVGQFRQFLRVAFGDQHFEENLRFVTGSLGVKNLRDYFVKSFYKDHLQRYKKRPVYWLFSSPKGSFNALIYMHRYTPSTVSTVLNEYLREFKAKLAASREHYERLATSNGTPREKAAALKEVDRLRKVLLELDEYEHDVLYPLASQQVQIDLDDGVKANYPKLGAALKKIPGLEVSDE
ncbi:BREX-1 system adenine-specific DNA-methyltransferase PglX [Arthrobacter sp. CAN_A214]|uniref:BREX-1 system adenine-specific DNA-methyltransferase PglX n=1 Tax=Arthrobacter sp. CAN_A214 TaxID=2787720 RepID=UPI0018C9DC4C